MTRRILISASLWQFLASVPLLYCLLSESWIISPEQGETRGLFGVCRKGNSSCNRTDDCTPCDPNVTVVSCGDFGEDSQGLDREIIGGILVTMLIARGGFFVMSIVSLIANVKELPKGNKDDLPYRIILVEEISGAADMIIVAIYIAYNNVLLIDNPCRTYGVGFWLNFARLPAGVIYLRLVHPLFMSVIKSFLRKRRKSREDTKPLHEDDPGVLSHPANTDQNGV